MLSYFVSLGALGAVIDQGEQKCDDLKEVSQSQAGVSPQAKAFCNQFQAE